MNRSDRRRAASAQRKGAPTAGASAPDPAIAEWLATASALHNNSRFVEAAVVCRQVLSRDRDNFEALLLHGSAADNLGEAEVARVQLERASKLRPHDPRPWVMLGTHFTRSGDYGEALRACRQAIEVAPEFPQGHVALGTLLSLQRAYYAAEPAFRRAIDLAPGYLDAEINLGSCLFYLGRPDEALLPLRRVLAAVPNHPWALKNLAAALRALGQFDEALACYRRATAAAPQFADAHRDEGLLLLLLGQFEEGWRKYEWRRSASTRGVRPLEGEYWDGGSLAGRTILLAAEQGSGDTIQMLRYVPQIAAQAASVRLMLPRTLLRLEGDALASASLHAQDEAPPSFDCWAQLMSLPGPLATNADNIPAPVPYLHAPKSAHDGLSRKGTGGRAAGLVWAGNPEHENDHNRSIPFDRLGPLLALDGVDWFSLQVGPRAADAAGNGRLIDLAPTLRDFADTAAAIEALDLVVTVDTAVAHLAGAMGKPVWLLLPHVPDWRWLLDRDDTPWYPTMRLFRQSRRGDWDEMIGRVAAELARA